MKPNFPAEEVRVLFELLEDGRLIWKPRTLRAGLEAGALCKTRGVHVVTCGKTKIDRPYLVFAHVTGHWPDGRLLHRDMDRINDSFGNLVEVAVVPKHRRCSKPNLPGVAPSGRKFKARLVHEGKYRHLGTFATEEEAHACFAAEHVRIYGDASPYAKELEGNTGSNRELEHMHGGYDNVANPC